MSRQGGFWLNGWSSSSDAAWQVGAINADAVQRDVDARLAKANEEGQAAEVERDMLHRDKECLTTRVRTLEREAVQRARAKGGRAPGLTA